MATINHIRGDTFMYDVNITEAGTITEVRSQIRNSHDSLVAQVTVTDLGAGTYNLTVANTAGWSVGPLYMDIQITSGSTIRSTDIITINVAKDVTQ